LIFVQITSLARRSNRTSILTGRHPMGEHVRCGGRSSEAAKLLMPNTVRTVAEILALAEWPAEQLRLVVERWQPAAEVRIERIR
jgi:hypothetical protein